METRVRMLIADSAEISRILLKNLFINDYEITEAEYGNQVLELLQHDDFDILVLDSKLCNIDGIELLKQIKENTDWSRIPVVINFSEEDIERQIQVLELGADDYFVQPFDLQIIKCRISNLVKKNEILRKQFESDIAEIKNDLKFLTDTITDGIAEFIVKDRVILKKCNQEFCNQLGYSLSELKNSHDLTKLIRRADINRFFNILNRAKDYKRVICTEINFIKKSGTTVRLGLSINYIGKNKDLDANQYFVLFSDRTQQCKVKEQLIDMMDNLLYQAEKDKLTGIYNKEAFFKKAN